MGWCTLKQLFLASEVSITFLAHKNKVLPLFMKVMKDNFYHVKVQLGAETQMKWQN